MRHFFHTRFKNWKLEIGNCPDFVEDSRWLCHRRKLPLLRRGFTLIELLVVIAIISILASVVLASLNTAREKSRDAKRISDVNQIRIALELYFDDNNGYPLALDSASLVVPGYLPAIPLPPVGTGEAAYLYQGLGTGCVSYHLGATLENALHDSFGEDADAPANDTQAVACESAGATDFSGTDPVYDVKP